MLHFKKDFCMMEKLIRNNEPFLDTKKKIYVSQYSDSLLWMLTFKNKVFWDGLANGRCNWFL